MLVLHLPRLINLLAAAVLLWLPLEGMRVPAAHARPVAPGTFPPLIGDPGTLSAYWHDQRWNTSDHYACALYAQAGVLEAYGYNFEDELAAARETGLAEGWYSPGEGTIGLGQPLRARDIAFEVHGSPIAAPIAPQRALWRLQLALSAGRYALVNVDAQALSYYRGSVILWHTLWVTGLRLDASGRPTSVITNDSFRGAAIEYTVDEFLAAWGHDAFNFYAIFVTPPQHPQPTAQPPRPRMHPDYPLPSHLQGYP